MSMSKSNRLSPVLSCCALTGLLLLGACRDSSTPSEAASQPGAGGSTTPQEDPGFFSGLFGGSADTAPAPAAPGQIGVNTFLWRASLDTISFMPVASADPFGGVIITDWYSPPETPNERFKINIFILDRQLRSDGIRATVFRQTQSAEGRWIDSPVDAKTAAGFENSILTRARQLRIAAIQPQ
jgi:hypothetical protein